MAEKRKAENSLESADVPKEPKTNKYWFGDMKEKTFFRCNPIKIQSDKIIYVNLGVIAEKSQHIKNICELKKENENEISELPGDQDAWEAIMALSINMVDSVKRNLINIRRDLLIHTLTYICYEEKMVSDLLIKCISNEKINENETQWSLLPKKYFNIITDHTYTIRTPNDKYPNRLIIVHNSFALHVVEQVGLIEAAYDVCRKIMTYIIDGNYTLVARK